MTRPSSRWTSNGRAIRDAMTGVGLLVLLGGLAYVVAIVRAC